MSSTRTSVERPGSTLGKTRVCPHCKSVILDSASICPACLHHLRFGQQSETRVAKTYRAFHVEGTVTHAEPTTAEYSVIVSIRNGQGLEVKRQVIEVGAMLPEEQRTIDVTLEVSAPKR